MNKKAEWMLVWVGLALIAGFSYVEFLQEGGPKHMDIPDWGIIAGVALAV